MDSTKIDKNTVAIALGSNLGNRLYYLYKAEELMAAKMGEAIKRSSVYETPAWGIENQAAFLNSVVLFKTEHTAKETLDILRNIEKEMGRVRYQKWGPRIIDLDILYFNDDVIEMEDLKVPHPYLQERSFVLIPLVDVMPDKIHPVLGKSNTQLLEELNEDKPPSIFVKEHVS